MVHSPCGRLPSQLRHVTEALGPHGVVRYKVDGNTPLDPLAGQQTGVQGVSWILGPTIYVRVWGTVPATSPYTRYRYIYSYRYRHLYHYRYYYQYGYRYHSSYH